MNSSERERRGFRGARPRKEGIGLGSGREILMRGEEVEVEPIEGKWRGRRTEWKDEEGRDDLRDDMLHVVVLAQAIGQAAILGD